MIEGTVIRPLRRHPDERGYLVEILRSDWSDVFEAFAMSYVSRTYPGVVRAWHRHPRTRQRDTFAVLEGRAKVVVYDPDTGEVDEHFIGDDNPVLLSFDGSKWHGFKAIGDRPCLLINFPNKLYDYEDPDEERLPHDSDQIPYDWGIDIK